MKKRVKISLVIALYLNLFLIISLVHADLQEIELDDNNSAVIQVLDNDLDDVKSFRVLESTREVSMDEVLSHITPEFVANQVIVKFKEDVTLSEKNTVEKAIASVQNLVGVERSMIKSNKDSVNKILDKHQVKDFDKVFDEKSDSKITGNAISDETADELDNIVIIETEDAIEAIKDLNNSPDVEYAEPNYIETLDYVPNDPKFIQQWAHQNTQAELGWDIEKGDSEVIIAIIDTGIVVGHEDLKNNLVGDCTNGCPEGAGYDFVDIDTQSYINSGYSLIPEEDYTDPDNFLTDYHGHGTHCAGIAAAVSDNNVGVTGVCPNCKIMPIRAGFAILYGSSYKGSLEHDDIANAIYYAADNGADVISMSFGGSGYSSTMKAALDYATSKGVVLVAAAGNSDSDSLHYPSGYENVISVASTDSYDKKSYFSNYGETVDVAAPGSYILSTVPTTGVISHSSGYYSISGTSMACPYVAGLAGLILSKNQDWTPEEVREILKQGVDPVDEPDKYIGTGRVNVKKALDIDVLTDAIANITSPSNEQVFKNNVEIRGSATGESYTLYYSTGLYGPWEEIVNGDNVENGILGNWDISSVNDGEYFLKLVASDGNGHVEDKVKIEIGRSYLEGFPKKFNGEYQETSPTCADIDGDGENEIIAYRAEDVLNDVHIYAWNSDGSLLSGFPFSDYVGQAEGPISVGDVDNDGEPEIVFTASRLVYVLDKDGNLEPGWPYRLEYGLPGHSSPVLADLDNDNDLEIIIGESDWTSIRLNIVCSVDSDCGWDGWVCSPNSICYYPMNQLHAFHHDATYVDGFPISKLGDTHGTPAVADINNDGELEIVSTSGPRFFSGEGSYKNLEVFSSNGERLWSEKIFDIPSQGYVMNVKSPILANIDNDPQMEIIVNPGQYEGSTGQDSSLKFHYNNKIFAYNDDGTLVNGWPVILPNRTYNSYPSSLGMALGDVNNNNILDLAVGDYRGDMHLIDTNSKRQLNNWPEETDPDLDLTYNYFSGSPIIADINNDGNMDIIASASNQREIYAWDYEGNLISGFPKRLDSVTKASPLVCKIEDNKLALITISDKGSIYAYDLGAYPDNAKWTMFQHDTKHTGLYTGFDPDIIERYPLRFSENITLAKGIDFIKAAGDDYLDTLWIENNNLFYSRINDNAEIIKFKQPLTSDVYNKGYPSLVVKGDDLHIIWSDDSSGRSETYYYKISENTTLIDKKQITFEGSTLPKLIDNLDSLFLLFSKENNLYMKKLNYEGNAITEDILILNNIENYDAVNSGDKLNIVAETGEGVNFIEINSEGSIVKSSLIINNGNHPKILVIDNSSSLISWMDGSESLHTSLLNENLDKSSDIIISEDAFDSFIKEDGSGNIIVLSRESSGLFYSVISRKNELLLTKTIITNNEDPEEYFLSINNDRAVIIYKDKLTNSVRLRTTNQLETNSPKILDVNIDEIGTYSIKINFKTNEPSKAQLRILEDGQIVALSEDQTFSYNHSMIIENLNSSKKYSNQIYVEDTIGNSATVVGNFSEDGGDFYTRTTSNIPEIPTTFYGKVETTDGNPVPGLEVTAQWVDVDGNQFETTSVSMNKEEAIEIGDESYEGYFIFNQGRIKAKRNTMITLSAEDALNDPMPSFESKPGSRAFETDSIILSGEPPEINIISPESREYLAEEIPINIIFNSSKSLKVAYFILNNGNQINILGQENQEININPIIGNNELEIFVKDIAGVENSKTVSFDLVDNTPPNVSNNNPVYSTSNIRISASVSDAVSPLSKSCEVCFSTGLCNNWISADSEFNEGSLGGTCSYIVSKSEYPEGNYNFNFRVTDTSDNMGSGTEKPFSIDKTAPEEIVNLEVSPIPGENALDISWQQSVEPEFKEYRVYKTYVQEELFEVITNKSKTSLKDTSVESENTYTYRITVVDKSLNENSGKIGQGTVADTTIPIVSIINPTAYNTYTSNQIPLDYSVSEDSVCEYSLNNITHAIENTITANEGVNYLQVICNDGTNIGKSPIITFYVDTLPPVPVSFINITQEPNIKRLNLYWNDISDAAVYYVYKDTSNFNNLQGRQPIATISSNYYSDNNVLEDITYYYAVIPKDSNGNLNDNFETFSKTVTETTPPDKITDLQVNTIRHEFALNLVWSPVNASDFKEYRIYRKLSSFSNTDQDDLIYTINDISQTTFKDEPLSEGEDYYYAVTAVDLNNNEDIEVISKKGTVYEIIIPEIIINYPENNQYYKDSEITVEYSSNKEHTGCVYFLDSNPESELVDLFEFPEEENVIDYNEDINSVTFSSDPFTVNEVIKENLVSTNNLDINDQFTESTVIMTVSASPEAIEASGSFRLLDSEGYARIIAETDSGKELIIYSTDNLIFDTEEHQFSENCDETCFLENINIDKIKVEIENAEVYIGNINIIDNPGINLEEIREENNINKDLRISYKIQKIKDYIKENNLKWVAGDNPVIRMSYSDRKKLTINGTLPNTHGEDAYVSGILGDPETASQINDNELPDKFDWRDRHGESWPSPVKNQASCGSCWAFSVAGATEGVINLYYNQHLDIDLSEQEVVSCSGAGSCSGGWPTSALLWLYSDGVVDESCFQYTATNSNCNNRCSDYSTRKWIISQPDFNLPNIEALKRGIIENGTLSMTDWAWSHAITAVGYGYDSSGFYVIFKNSWGPNWGDEGYGKKYIPSTMSGFAFHAVGLPLTPPPGTDYEVACVDNDGDHLCSWGIGPKPDTCPSYCLESADEDDSDPQDLPDEDCKDPGDEDGNGLADCEDPACNEGDFCDMLHTKVCSYQSCVDRPGIPFDGTIVANEGENNLLLRCEDDDNLTGYSNIVTFNIDTQSPEPISGLSAVNSQQGQDTVLSWYNYNGSDLAHYNIYRSNEDFNNVDSMSPISQASLNTYTDSGLEPGLYYYAVTAVDKAGNENTEVTTASVNIEDISPPDPITGLQVGSIQGENSLQLSWNPSSDDSFDKYRIYRSNNSFSSISGGYNVEYGYQFGDGPYDHSLITLYESDERIHFLWRDDHKIYNQFTDEWTEIGFPAQSTVRVQGAVMGKDNIIYAFYSVGSGTNSLFQMYYMKFDGNSWSQPIFIKDISTNILRLPVVEDNGNNLHVFINNIYVDDKTINHVTVDKQGNILNDEDITDPVLQNLIGVELLDNDNFLFVTTDLYIYNFDRLNIIHHSKYNFKTKELYDVFADPNEVFLNTYQGFDYSLDNERNLHILYPRRVGGNIYKAGYEKINVDTNTIVSSYNMEHDLYDVELASDSQFKLYVDSEDNVHAFQRISPSDDAVNPKNDDYIIYFRFDDDTKEWMTEDDEIIKISPPQSGGKIESISEDSKGDLHLAISESNYYYVNQYLYSNITAHYGKISFENKLPIAEINDISQTTYKDLNLVSGATYHYAVTAVDTNNLENPSVNSVNGTVWSNAPFMVNITSPINGTYYNNLNISFNYTSDNPVISCNYILNNISHEYQPFIIADEGINTLTLSCISQDNSTGQDRVIFYVDTTPPEQIKNLNITQIQNQNTLRLTWDPYNGEDFSNYRIYRSDEEFDDVSEMVPLAQVSKNSFNNTDLEVGTYYYAVTAIDNGGNENFSVVSVESEVIIQDTIAPDVSVIQVDNEVYGLVSLSANVHDDKGLKESCLVCISSDGTCDTEWVSATNNFAEGNLTGSCMFEWDTKLYEKRNYTYNFKVSDLSDNEGIGISKVTTVIEPIEYCSDGTVYDQCSVEKPIYCDNGTLLDNCSVCGCPNGFECSQNGSCYVPRCEDGTLFGSCSLDIPLFCINGTLIDNCGLCGCNNNLSCSNNGSCYVPSCSDGTLYNECSLDKPFFCDNGTLIDNCQVCGCEDGFSCDIKSKKCIEVPEVLNCTDGTLFNTCSLDKPSYCDNGTLIDNCQVCGCEDGFECSQNSSCSLPVCNDGTLYNDCSVNQPKQCINGTLIDNCKLCGCPDDYYCENSTDQCLVIPFPVEDISLDAGWNLISLPLDVPDNSVSSILSSLSGRYVSLFTYDPITKNWASYKENQTIFDQSNSLTNIEIGKAYWIEMNQPTTLSIEGEIEDSYSKNLVSGWNFIGYPYLTATSVESALSSINDKYDIIYAYEPQSGWLSYTPYSTPLFNNTLETMEPGKGYWIYMYESATWKP